MVNNTIKYSLKNIENTNFLPENVVIRYCFCRS